MSDDSHEYDEDALEFIEDERVRIAALHATCPKQIWLQVDPEAEQFDGWDAQTWCSDKINETDVRYVLAASRDAEVADLTLHINQACKWVDDTREENDQLRVQIKQKDADNAELVAALEAVIPEVAGGNAGLIAYNKCKAALAKVRKPT